MTSRYSNQHAWRMINEPMPDFDGDSQDEPTSASTPDTGRVTRSRKPLRGVLITVVVLLLFPLTRHLITLLASAVFGVMTAAVCFLAGALLAAFVLLTPKRRR